MTLKCLKRENEVYHHPGYMPTFGYGLQLYLCNDCNVSKSSQSRLGFGQSYKTPFGLVPDSNEAKSFLAGEY
jgi:hypothetical protein